MIRGARFHFEATDDGCVTFVFAETLRAEEEASSRRCALVCATHPGPPPHPKWLSNLLAHSGPPRQSSPTGLPGDLVLISPLAPTWTQKVIQAAQNKGGYRAEDAQWTHAAVYLGTGFTICEATALKGVRQGSLLDSLANHLANHLVPVRRDNALDSDTRWRMALEAALQIGTRYGLVSGAKFGVRALKGLHRPQKSNTQSTSALNCSELFADAHQFATGRTLQWQHPGREVSPAFLSFVPELTDVANGVAANLMRGFFPVRPGHRLSRPAVN